MGRIAPLQLETHGVVGGGGLLFPACPAAGPTGRDSGLGPGPSSFAGVLGRAEAAVTVAPAGTEEGMSEEEQGSGTTTGCGLPR